jgi:hypothetical protein
MIQRLPDHDSRQNDILSRSRTQSGIRQIRNAAEHAVGSVSHQRQQFRAAIEFPAPARKAVAPLTAAVSR